MSDSKLFFLVAAKASKSISNEAPYRMAQLYHIFNASRSSLLIALTIPSDTQARVS